MKDEIHPALWLQSSSLLSCLLPPDQHPAGQHVSLTERGAREKNQSVQMRAVQRDYLASNRVLAPTLRLKPFSITEISADVAPASPDPLELPASCPLRVCRFSASRLGHSVRPPLISRGWPGTMDWLQSRLTDSQHRPRQVQCTPTPSCLSGMS